MHISVYPSLSNTNDQFHLKKNPTYCLKNAWAFLHFFSNLLFHLFYCLPWLKILIRIGWSSIFEVFPCRLGVWVLAHRPLTEQWHLFPLRTLLAKDSDVAHFLCSWTTEVVSGFISRADFSQLLLEPTVAPSCRKSKMGDRVTGSSDLCRQWSRWLMLNLCDSSRLRLMAQAQEGPFCGRQRLPVVVICPHALDVCALDTVRSHLTKAYLCVLLWPLISFWWWIIHLLFSANRHLKLCSWVMKVLIPGLIILAALGNKR